VQSKPFNWVFLGDSLTEGVGSQRISHVTEFVERLREDQNKNGIQSVHHMRLRAVDPEGFDRFVRFNLAGFLDADPKPIHRELWIWNLACEGRTIETDSSWLSFLINLQPELIIIFRGSLESVIRPAMANDGVWPWWVPQSWRRYSQLDPRCYFSSTWWRKAKQVFVDDVKQRTRRKLLKSRPGLPLMDLRIFIDQYNQLLTDLQKVSANILMLGLLPVNEKHFPGSREQFNRVNQKLEELAKNRGVEFIDWGEKLETPNVFQEFFYRDGFHPNQKGAKLLAEILQNSLKQLGY
jgi:lysophospholipase L1-like esterase